MAAPAECASSADAAICRGVTGTFAFFLTESPEPVMAQVMKTALVNTAASPHARGMEPDERQGHNSHTIAPKPGNAPSPTATAGDPRGVMVAIQLHCKLLKSRIALCRTQAF